MLSLAVAALLAAQAPVAAPPAEPPADPAPVPAIVAPPTPDCCTVKALTPVKIAIVQALSSDGVHASQPFDIRLLEPIVLENGLNIPVGTPGRGEVVHAARSGMAGKPGELLLAARYLELDGIRIPLRSLRFGPRSGKDNTGTALVATAAVGVIGMAITGKEVRVPAGMAADAKVAADTRIDGGKLSPPAAVATIVNQEGTAQ